MQSTTSWKIRSIQKENQSSKKFKPISKLFTDQILKLWLITDALKKNLSNNYINEANDVANKLINQY